jgi:antitoxin ParD1/3/4
MLHLEEKIMNVSLTSALERFVQERIKTGRYNSASEVVRDALRLLQDHEQVRKMRIEELRKEIAIGTAQADAGQLIDGEKVFAEIRKKIEEIRRKDAA